MHLQTSEQLCMEGTCFFLFRVQIGGWTCWELSSATMCIPGHLRPTFLCLSTSLMGLSSGVLLSISNLGNRLPAESLAWVLPHYDPNSVKIAFLNVNTRRWSLRMPLSANVFKYQSILWQEGSDVELKAGGNGLYLKRTRRVTTRTHGRWENGYDKLVQFHNFALGWFWPGHWKSI